MADINRFWMVWNPHGRSPTYRHESRESANKEAQRLARDNPGQVFVVLKAVGAFKSDVTDPAAIPIIKWRGLQDESASAANGEKR